MCGWRVESGELSISMCVRVVVRCRSECEVVYVWVESGEWRVES